MWIKPGYGGQTGHKLDCMQGSCERKAITIMRWIPVIRNPIWNSMGKVFMKNMSQ